MRIKETTCFEAEDGSLYRTREEADAYSLTKAAQTIEAAAAGDLQKAVTSPAEYGALIAAVKDIAEVYVKASLA